MRGSDPSGSGHRRSGILTSAATEVAIDDYEPAPGHHLCSVWTDPRRDRLAAVRFLRRPQGGGAVWIQDPSRRDVLVDDAEGVRTFSTDEVHLLGGTFDPQRMYRFWRERAAECGAGGCGRAVAEMAWALREAPGTEQAPEFEASLNSVLAPLSIAVICQYGSVRFRPALILAMILSHPLVVIGDRVYANPFAVPEGEFPARWRTLAEYPVASLVPLWRHFLHRLPSAADVAAFLCNSLPIFLPAGAVAVRLGSGAGACRLDVAEDRLTVGEAVEALDIPTRRLFAIWPGSGGIVGGTLSTGRCGMRAAAEAVFEGDRGRLVVTATRALTQSELMLFTTLASDVGSALAHLPGRPVPAPFGHA